MVICKFFFKTFCWTWYTVFLFQIFALKFIKEIHLYISLRGLCQLLVAEFCNFYKWTRKFPLSFTQWNSLCESELACVYMNECRSSHRKEPSQQGSLCVPSVKWVSCVFCCLLWCSPCLIWKVFWETFPCQFQLTSKYLSGGFLLVCRLGLTKCYRLVLILEERHLFLDTLWIQTVVISLWKICIKRCQHLKKDCTGPVLPAPPLFYLTSKDINPNFFLL